MPREELIALYPRASVVVAPCIVAADGNRDGLPTVLIEAMALEVPVVSTPVTGIPELVRHEETGLLAPPHDPAGLATAIERTIRDHSRSVEMARAGRARVEQHFDIRQNVAKLRELFEQASASA
jgi:glycosyltransferase involved in cell wall biosynthesis